MKLLELIKEYSGFYNETCKEKYVGFLQNEIQELLDAETRNQVISELGDVLGLALLIAEKYKQEHNISDYELFASQARKFKFRTPHVFERVYKSRQLELEYNYKVRGVPIPKIHIENDNTN